MKHRLRNISLLRHLASFGFALLLACLCVVSLGPGMAFAEEQEDSRLSNEQLSDLGEGNLINIQQTPDNGFLYDSSIYDLNNAEVSYQGNKVQVKGEVVGNSVLAGQNPGKRWITLNTLPGENEGSISVLVDEDSLSLIDTYGSYGCMGTTLIVNGTFHVTCSNHEGIMDIHADTVTLVARGEANPDEFRPEMLIPGALLCAIGLFLFMLYRFLAESER